MLSNGQEIILFIILLILALIYLNKYITQHKIVINKFIFTASILRAIIIILLEEPNKSNISTNINPVIWALYIVIILYYKIIKDEEYDTISFSLFLGVNALCTATLSSLYLVMHLLFLDKELIIKNIFIIIGSGLTSGFLYTFFKEYTLKKMKDPEMLDLLNRLIFIQLPFAISFGEFGLLTLIMAIIYFGTDEEDRFGCFLLYSLINLTIYIYLKKNNLIISNPFLYKRRTFFD